MTSPDEVISSSVVDPNQLLRGVVLVLAPHMDDEVLACGGTLAALQDKTNVHFVYATDGSKSPVPMFLWQGRISPELPSVRIKEARAALAVLEIPHGNIGFLGFPDADLESHFAELVRSLKGLARQLSPSVVLVPFRYDRHPDHLALHRAAISAWGGTDDKAQILEYFVYNSWRLIPGGDIRKHIRTEYLLRVDVGPHAATKRKALACFASQATRYFAWQERPILPERLLEEVSTAPEYFLKYDPDVRGAGILAKYRSWIPLVHFLEPMVKKKKDRLFGLFRIRKFAS